jgi:hypothetical protein
MARPQGILGQVEAHDSPLARLASDHLPVKARIRLAEAATDTAAALRAPEADAERRRNA